MCAVEVNRRDFIRGSAAAMSGAAAWSQTARQVALIIDPRDSVAMAVPVQWAAQELERAASASRHTSIDEAPAGLLCIVASGHSTSSVPESFEISASDSTGRTIVRATAGDIRGLMYALLELSGRAQRHSDLLAGLPVSVTPANKVRSVARLFVSDVEDKPWFNDREMWPNYLAMLAANRFNQFHLALGIGHDFLRGVTDAYFLFPYPFLLAVPGYNVRAVGLADNERDRNLETLKFISEQTVAHGIQFQLGLWMHGYEWIDSPHPNYTIAGLTAANHAAYCRDALANLLKACPAIGGVTFRIHGESGVAEGSYAFWKTVFDGVVRSGRKIDVDLHTKGIDQNMIDIGFGTGMPVRLSPKFWAEHMGMPYHQADIRAQEIPRSDHKDQGLMALSTGSRSFTRYGYADLLREDRRYDVIYRVWPGTQRVLLWNDPVTAAAYSRAFGFCGSVGADLCEPLSFKGRRGSGLPGGRCGYADRSLNPRWDWQKYASWYRVWGQKLYDPEAQVYLSAVEGAVAIASRILPIITTAHGPSAANNAYWPEMYTNQSIVDASRKHQYSDMPAPKVFGNVSPFDPQLFSRINECADELMKGEPSAKYSPVNVATWLERTADRAENQLRRTVGAGADFQRMSIDAFVEINTGRFFAAKFRSGLLWEIFERSGDRTALEEAVKAYKRARLAWVAIASRTKGVYAPDVTYGEQTYLRGHWVDRLPAIDEDIAAMERRLEGAEVKQDERAKTAVQAALAQNAFPQVECGHTPPMRFKAGEPLRLEIESAASPVRLYYRHVNQAERWRLVAMQPSGKSFGYSIPGDYTNSPYPLQYYFEFNRSLYPGFGVDLTRQPYLIVRRA